MPEVQIIDGEDDDDETRRDFIISYVLARASVVQINFDGLQAVSDAVSIWDCIEDNCNEE